METKKNVQKFEEPLKTNEWQIFNKGASEKKESGKIVFLWNFTQASSEISSKSSLLLAWCQTWMVSRSSEEQWIKKITKLSCISREAQWDPCELFAYICLHCMDAAPLELSEPINTVNEFITSDVLSQNRFGWNVN